MDDEYNAREFLEKLLTRYFPEKFLILDKCESVDDAIAPYIVELHAFCLCKIVNLSIKDCIVDKVWANVDYNYMVRNLCRLLLNKI